MTEPTENRDVLERAQRHLATMAPHVRDRLTARLLSDVCRELKWERGRWPGKITMHWLKAAFDRIAAGEPENEVMADFGYERSTPASAKRRVAADRLKR